MVRPAKLNTKLVVFTTIEEFGWVVAATGNTEDFYAPLRTLRTIFLSLLVLAILASIIVSIYLSRSITAPLNHLLAHLSSHSYKSEQSGLIVPLAKQIYEQAFRETAVLLQQGYKLKVSVNLAPSQLQAETFLREFLEIQEKSSLPTEYIELEITESSLMKNVEQSRSTLEQLGKLGFCISIDDFGTGYSSLQYLKQLPLHTLKIDMSFVSGIGIDRDDEKLIETIVLMARQFGLMIVAEGVEQRHQEDFLRTLGCHYGQGYLYGKPMDIATFTKWLRERSNSAHAV